MLLQRFGKGGGLAEAGTARLGELLLQPRILIPQTIALALNAAQVLLRTIQLRSESFIVAANPLDVIGGTFGRGHAPVMPELSRRYKTR